MLCFSKYHGLGNDFVVVNRLAGGEPLSAAFVRWICERHRGVGADGVLTIWPDPQADARMQVQNADGSDAEMCGNGLRCVARYLIDAGHVSPDRDSLTVRSGEGVHACVRRAADRFRVSMGRAEFAHADIPAPKPSEATVQLAAGGESVEASCLVIGNPHAVVFGQAEPGPRASELGPLIERLPHFPRRVNVSFARATGDGFDAVVHERGVGVTKACGSGACAVGVAAIERGLWPAGRPMIVRLPGGPLMIEVDADGQIHQEGEAIRVFVGQMELT